MFRHHIFIYPISACMAISAVACSEKATTDNTPDTSIKESLYDWGDIASSSQAKLEDDFWKADGNFYWIDNTHTDATFFHYWQTAHAMETIMDAYERTGDNFYRERTRTVLSRIKKSTGGKYTNQYYDDMAWMGIACLRAYDLFQEDEYLNAANILWEDVQKGWVEPDGGMLWNKNPADAEKRNSCTHWTVADFGTKMYRHTRRDTDLEFAIKVHKWAYENLYNQSLGAAIDQTGGNVYTTYNQGVLIGSSMGLYNITGRKTYLELAEKCADFCISNDKFGKDGIWRDEGASNGLNRNNGIFKGILCHYMKDFIVSDDCPENRRKYYIQYMEQMGVTLYNATHNDFLFPGDWRRCAYDGECIYLGCQLSGVILMECNWIFSQKYPDLMKYVRTVSL